MRSSLLSLALQRAPTAAQPGSRARFLPAAVLALSPLAVPQEQRLDTDAPGVHSSCLPQVSVAPGGAVHVVWQDRRDGTFQVYYRRGEAFGASFPAAEVRLSAWGTAAAARVVHGGDLRVYAVWHAFSEGEERIYFRHSADGGLSWTGASPETQLNAALAATPLAGEPEIAANAAGHVFVVWTQWENGRDTLYLSRSTNSGLDWFPPVAVHHLPGSRAIDSAPRLATDPQGRLHIAYIHDVDPFDGLNPQLWEASSLNGGATFPYRTLLSDPLEVPQETALVATPGGIVHVAWTDATNALLAMRNPQAGRPTGWPEYPSVVDTPEPGHKVAQPSLAVDPAGRAFAVYTYLPAFQVCSGLGAGSPEPRANVLPITSSVWGPEIRLDTGIATKLIPAHPRVAWVTSGAVAVWMHVSAENGVYTDIACSSSTDGTSWSPATQVNPDLGSDARAAFPRLDGHSGKAAIVWDDRRHFSPPPGGPLGTPEGAPESYFLLHVIP